MFFVYSWLIAQLFSLTISQISMVKVNVVPRYALRETQTDVILKVTTQCVAGKHWMVTVCSKQDFRLQCLSYRAGGRGRDRVSPAGSILVKRGPQI